MSRVSGYKDLLGKENVSRWYKNLARGSPTTADLYLKALAKFCRDVDIDPNTLLEKDDVEIRNLLMDYIAGLEEKSGSYASTFVKAVKSWLEFNDRTPNFRVRIRGVHETKVSETERVPTNDELRKILMVADPRARVAISLIAFSGVRLEVLGNHLGTDGLRIKDLPDLRIGYKVEFVRVPAMVIVRANLNKVGHQYITFLTEEGCEYLESYLNMRLRRGESLTESSPIIPKRGGGFLKTPAIGEMIRKVIRSAGFNWRPYVFRHYFDTYMLMAEGAKLVLNDYRVFWMGHKGNIEHQYTTNKYRLPKALIEDMRSKYELAAKMFLETKPPERVTGPKQKAIKPEEIDEYLESGWEYVATLPNGKVIVKRV